MKKKKLVPFVLSGKGFKKLLTNRGVPNRNVVVPHVAGGAHQVDVVAGPPAVPPDVYRQVRVPRVRERDVCSFRNHFHAL